MIREIKGYSIQGKIAKGGMGEIYKGIHKGLKKEVILKKLISGAPISFFERFKREAAIMMEISHPNIVHVFDFFKEEKNSFIVMEYVTGYNLSEIIKQHKKLPVYLAAFIILEIAKGLEFAHSRGIIHRDIKPANVLISTSGDIKLTDFGIAFKQDDQKSDNITKTGVLLGTPAYMSPEQIYSSRDVDLRADIYSLGILFYQMLTGTRPYSNEFSKENVYKIKKGKCPSISSFNKNVPGRIRRIIKKMMHPKKAKRYDSAEDVIKEIGPFLKGRFKKMDNARALFSTLIKEGDNRVLPQFTFSRAALAAAAVARLGSFLLLFLFLFSSAFFLVPGPFLQVIPWQQKPGLLNAVINSSGNDNRIRLYRVKQGNKGRRIPVFLFKNKNLYKASNVLLFPGKYTFYIQSNQETAAKEIVVTPYEGEKPIQLEWNVRAPGPAPVNLEVAVSDTAGRIQTDYTLFYKEHNHKLYLAYEDHSLLYTGKVYDFKLEKSGFVTAFITGVSIDQWKKDLKLHFLLSYPER